MEIVTDVRNLLDAKIKNLGYDVVSVTFAKEGKDLILRLVIDRDGDISLDEVVQVSDLVSEILDVEDLIESNYLLDVTTLGAEKPIEINKLSKYIDKYVNVHLSTPLEGENYIEGFLKDSNEETTTIEIQIKARKKLVNINTEHIDRARLAIKF